MSASEILKESKFNITKQGSIGVEDVFVYKESIDFCILLVPLSVKYYNISTIGCDENGYSSLTLDLKEDNEFNENINDNTNDYDYTEIVFTDYKDWNIFSTERSKYTLGVVLVKN